MPPISSAHRAICRGAHGPVPALHLAGLVLAAIAAVGTGAALALPAVPNTALSRG